MTGWPISRTPYRMLMAMIAGNSMSQVPTAVSTAAVAQAIDEDASAKVAKREETCR